MNSTTDPALREALLGLRHPRRPSRARLPWQLHRELPNPLHEEGWRRFTHADITALSQPELLSELERVRLLCLSYPEEAPAWLLERALVLRRALDDEPLPSEEVGAA